jgi:hypothetical protein
MGKHFIIFFLTYVNTNVIGWAALQGLPYRKQQEESAVCWFYNDVVEFIRVDYSSDSGGLGSLMVVGDCFLDVRPLFLQVMVLV